MGLAAATALLARQAGRRARWHDDASEASRPHPSATKLRQGAAILGASVLLDSALEHFRAGFDNRAMFLAPAMGAFAMASGQPASQRALRSAKQGGHTLSIIFGATGLSFHLFNILKRPGGMSWNNLFYAAPIGAPGALSVAGALNLSADAIDLRLRDGASRPRPARRAGRLLAVGCGAAIAVESAEVALLHFRGAYHNPAMFAPVTVPPAAALLLIHRAARPEHGGGGAARLFLHLTAVLGVVGTGFHIYGVGRNMGGWRNWRQNVLVGPPLPAPISFAGLALAGLAALGLLDEEGERDDAPT